MSLWLSVQLRSGAWWEEEAQWRSLAVRPKGAPPTRPRPSSPLLPGLHTWSSFSSALKPAEHGLWPGAQINLSSLKLCQVSCLVVKERDQDSHTAKMLPELLKYSVLTLQDSCNFDPWAPCAQDARESQVCAFTLGHLPTVTQQKAESE